jgi:hypothetical protein
MSADRGMSFPLADREGAVSLRRGRLAPSFRCIMLTL